MEMNEFEAILHVVLLNILECRQEFTRSQTKLASIATTLFPLARARCCQLDADTHVGTHTQFLGSTRDDFQFVEFLHHNENALTHLLGEQRQLYVILVFIAIADDQRIAVHIDRQHGMQFWLRTRFQTQVELLAMLDDFLHHGANLIDLNGVNDEVLPIVAILIGSLLEAGGSLLNTVIDDVRESHQHRC